MCIVDGAIYIQGWYIMDASFLNSVCAWMDISFFNITVESNIYL